MSHRLTGLEETSGGTESPSSSLDRTWIHAIKGGNTKESSLPKIKQKPITWIIPYICLNLAVYGQVPKEMGGDHVSGAI